MCNPWAMHNTDTIGTTEVALILDVDRSTVTRMAKAGKLPVKFRGSGQTGELFFSRRAITKLTTPASAPPSAGAGVSSSVEDAA